MFLDKLMWHKKTVKPNMASGQSIGRLGIKKFTGQQKNSFEKPLDLIGTGTIRYHSVPIGTGDFMCCFFLETFCPYGTVLIIPQR